MIDFKAILALFATLTVLSTTLCLPAEPVEQPGVDGAPLAVIQPIAPIIPEQPIKKLPAQIFGANQPDDLGVAPDANPAASEDVEGVADLDTANSWWGGYGGWGRRPYYGGWGGGWGRGHGWGGGWGGGRWGGWGGGRWGGYWG